MDKFEYKKYLYYGIIGIVSIVVLVFLPMIGSDAGLGFKLPTTVAGWCLWIITKLITAVLNVLIFHCFMEQAKINVAEDENYKKANELLNKVKNKIIIPRGPSEWNKTQYSTKAVSIFSFTALSTIAISNAILTYDYISAITYFVTIMMGVVMGIMQMKSAEAYWTNEYYLYAKMKFDELKEIEQGEETQCLLETEKSTEI